MQVGIDVSQVIYGTGVSDYTLSLLGSLPPETMVPVGFSLRRASEIKALLPAAATYPLPPRLLDILWNHLHLLPAETFFGSVDVLHASDWTQPPAHCPVVTTIHDLAPFLYPRLTDPAIISVHKAKMAWAVKECSCFICVSQNTARDLQKIFNIPGSKITVIYEALPAKSLLTPGQSPYHDYLLAMGSRQKRKNIPRLVSAYLRYKSQLHLPEKLVITGENILSSSDPSVIFTGFVSDQELVNLMASARAFIYPSLYEGFGQPVLEGFYHRVPVVAGNTSSLPEVAGNAAVLVDPASEEAIAAGIALALKDRSRLVAAGLKQLAKFSWDQAAAATLAAYKSLC